MFGNYHCFSVEISPEKTIDRPKEAIVAKTPDRFLGNNAYWLAIWKVIASKAKLSDLHDEDLFDETTKLGQYFIGAPRKCVSTS